MTQNKEGRGQLPAALFRFPWLWRVALRTRHFGLQRFQRPKDNGLTERFLIFRAHLGVAQGVDDPVSLDDAVGAHHLGDGRDGRDLGDGYARPLQLGGDRSAAARAGPSSGGENDGINARFLQRLGHFAPQATAVGNGVGKPRH